MGWAAKMANVSFNRKRVKLKQVLGIRARLALLAVILVTPLMFERIRSLEDTRARQIGIRNRSGQAFLRLVIVAAPSTTGGI